jgi:hypothetical protein
MCSTNTLRAAVEGFIPGELIQCIPQRSVKRKLTAMITLRRTEEKTLDPKYIGGLN